MKKNDAVIIYLPETKKRGPSQFHGRIGRIAYRSDLPKRWFVHIEGDPRGTDTEFCEDEILRLANPSLQATGATKRKKSKRAVRARA